MIRAYAPIGSAEIDALKSEGRFPAAHVMAVTPGIEALAPDGDAELHEHLASQLAAAAATSDPVVVCAFDVRPERISSAESGSTPGRVELVGDVVARDVACFLVADPGERVGEDADLELSWFDASEVDEVRRLLG